MKARWHVMASMLLLVTIGTTTTAQDRATLDGAWIPVGTRMESPDSTYWTAPMTGFSVISGRHFMQLYVREARAGVQQASRPSTAEEKAARYDLLVANGGTLEMRGDTLLFRYEQAKLPTLVGTTAVRRYRLRNDTLWLTWTQPWQRDSSRTVRGTATFVRKR